MFQKLAIGLTLFSQSWCLTLAWEKLCDTCEMGEGLQEFLRPEGSDSGTTYNSHVHVLWPTYIEVVPITSDVGGWEPPSLHKTIAEETLRGWEWFRKKIVPNVPKDHELQKLLKAVPQSEALSNAFFRWQELLFQHAGDVAAALAGPDAGSSVAQTPSMVKSAANTSWPGMCAMPEYSRLRKIVERLSTRYLERSGLQSTAVHSLNYTVSNRAIVHEAGMQYGPRTSLGDFNVALFFAQVSPTPGMLRISDPRGHSDPFGRSFDHVPRAGELLLFPSWVSHAVTPELLREKSIASKDERLARVVISFSIGPDSGPMRSHLWANDPTGDMRFSRRSPIDPEELKLNGALTFGSGQW